MASVSFIKLTILFRLERIRLFLNSFGCFFFFFSGYKGLVDVDKKGVPGLTVTTADRFERTRYITFINNLLYENNHALTLTVSPSLSQCV
jgi:hypothetical protein